MDDSPRRGQGWEWACSAQGLATLGLSGILGQPGRSVELFPHGQTELSPGLCLYLLSRMVLYVPATISSRMCQELGSLRHADCPQSTFAVLLLTDELGAGEKEIGIIFLVLFKIAPWVLYFLFLHLSSCLLTSLCLDVSLGCLSVCISQFRQREGRQHPHSTLASCTSVRTINGDPP